ncbi:MAG: hypothetical protein GY786_14555, partial [Proteobacteria bacterium]|nr:hypothetical protein [Pseudomonadota bacterium]
GEREEGTTIHLKHVVWSQPIVVDGSARKVHIGLFEEESGQIQYEIYTQSDNDEESIVHSQGVAEVKTKEDTPPLDIQDLQSHMNQGTLSAEDCYEAFKEMGIDYGDGQQGIRKIYQGENQVLARLSIPTSVQDTLGEYVHNPSLTDSALQSSIGLMIKSDLLSDGKEIPPGVSRWPRGTNKSPRGTNKSTLRPSLPFALESLEIMAPCTSQLYAWVRYSDGGVPTDKSLKLNIDLFDEKGDLCAKLRGVSYALEKVTLKKKATTRWEFSKSKGHSQDSNISSLSSVEKVQKFLQQAIADALQKSVHQIHVDQSFFEIG